MNNQQVKSFVERIEHLSEEKRTIAADIKEVYSEAKSMGYDTKAMRKVVALRRIDRNEREQEESMLALYMNALGMLIQVDEAVSNE